MAAGRVGGGRSGGRAGGARGPAGASGASKGGSEFRVDRNAPAAGSAATSGAAGATAVDPATLKALEVSQQLREGILSSKREATERLVDEILRRKLRTKSTALTGRITDALEEDPHVSQLLERLWAKG